MQWHFNPRIQIGRWKTSAYAKIHIIPVHSYQLGEQDNQFTLIRSCKQIYSTTWTVQKNEINRCRHCRWPMPQTKHPPTPTPNLTMKALVSHHQWPNPPPPKSANLSTKALVSPREGARKLEGRVIGLQSKVKGARSWEVVLTHSTLREVGGCLKLQHCKVQDRTSDGYT